MYYWKRIVLLTMIFLCGSVPVEAKLLPRFQGTKTTNRDAVVSTGVVTSPRLRADHGALIIYFANLQNAVSVNYTLTYRSNGIDQGVGGTLDAASGSSVTRELYFGTCSSGVCRPHAGLTNARLEVSIEMTNGRKILRRYRIRV